MTYITGIYESNPDDCPHNGYLQMTLDGTVICEACKSELFIDDNDNNKEN